jgi:hypothetical protein
MHTTTHPSIRTMIRPIAAICTCLLMAGCLEEPAATVSAGEDAPIGAMATVPASAETVDQIGVRYWQLQPGDGGAVVSGLDGPEGSIVVQLQIIASADRTKVDVVRLAAGNDEESRLRSDGTASGPNSVAALTAMRRAYADLKANATGESNVQSPSGPSANSERASALSVSGLECSDQCLVDYAVCLAGSGGSPVSIVICYAGMIFCQVNCPPRGGGGSNPIPPPACAGTCCEQNSSGKCTKCVPKGGSCP